MTKIKNTKKGMAKKTLSMSLVVAMLATSNVPVWAAEFSDGSDVAVATEAPATDDTTADVAEEAFTDEAAPEVATEETVTPATAAEVNYDNYTSNFKITMNPAGWGNGNPVTAEGELKDSNGNIVKTTNAVAGTDDQITANYTWLANGREAHNSNASTDIAANTEIKGTTSSPWSYTPDLQDFNKTLSLMITVKRGNTVIYQETIEGGIVGARDISSQLNSGANTTLAGLNDASKLQYDGKEKKLVPTNTYTAESGKITNKHITWNYATEGNDFTNYTNKTITVVGTLEGTYDANSDAYGYKGQTVSGTYKVAKRNIADVNNFVPTLKTTSVQFTGKPQKFGKADVTLGVKIDNDTTIDITDAIDPDYTFEGTSGQEAVTDKGYTLNIPVAAIKTDSKAFNNFTIDASISSLNATTTNKYKIVKRDLSKCTGEVKTDIKFDLVKDSNDQQLLAYINTLGNKIELKGDDGKTFTLDDISNYVTVTVESALTNAIKNKTTGVVNNAIKIAYKSDEQSVTGSILLPVRLTTQSLSDATITVTRTNDDGSTTNVSLAETVADAKTAGKSLNLKYDGKAKKLEDMKNFALTGVSGIQSGEYEISYDDNVNAGIVKVTLTGKKSYEGSVKNFYFKIKPASVAPSDASVAPNGVTINPANDTDAALYKDAVDLKIEKELVSGDPKTKLEEGKDYTVKYYYTSADKSSVNTKQDAEAIKNDGSNVVGDYVTAVVNITKGNYSSDGEQYFAKSVRITEKSIKNVTITLEKTSYTFTGKEIVPEVVVKDGSSILEKGVDYSLQVKDNKNVGTATVTVKALAGSDYKTDSTASTTFTITPAKAEDVKVVLSENTVGTVKKAEAVSGKENTFKYNKGKQIQPKVEKPNITLNGFDVTDEFDIKRLTYGDNNQAGKEMGSVTISPKTGNKNFDGTKTQKFNIEGTTLTGTLSVYGSNKKAIAIDSATKAILSSTYRFYYSGKDCTFADAALVPSVAAAKEGTDYEIKYVNNVDAGYGFVIAVAKGNYEGHATSTTWNDADHKVNYALNDGKLTKNGVTLATNVIDAVAFTINPAVFTAKNITVTNGVYATGLPVKPQVTVSVAGKTLVEGTDYKLSIRPQSSDKGFTYPDSIINATDGKIFYVDVLPMGGYKFDDVDGSNTFAWGIDKFNFAAADITSSGDTVTVKNGNMTVDSSDYTVTKDEKAGTVTITAKEGSKNYTGSQTVKANNVQIQAPVISGVNVVGNKATVILSGESNGASGYDYVISKANDYTTDRVDVTKNQVKTTGDFKYVQQGTYYAYCHAWTRDANGKKVFSGWSNIYPFSVTAITPDAPVITNVKVSGSTIKVTYKAAANATGYDVVLGTGSKKENGETRPYQYGNHKVLNLKEGTVTATFKNVPKGTWVVGMHAFNRTSENGKKVFSKWSNLKKATVK